MTDTPLFRHLLTLSTDIGIYEHADHAAPRREHGYCTDDAARVLIAVSREPDPSRDVVELGRTAFRFLTCSQGVNGEVRNRRGASGRWEDRRGVEDCWGRSIWAFGTAARRAPERWMQESALSYFERGIEQRSAAPRAMAFAALGAAEVLDRHPGHRGALAVLADAIDVIGPIGGDPSWSWPEPSLTYANAALAEALIAAGWLLGREDATERGLTMLRWLLDRESLDGHLSPTPAGGSGPEHHAPAFDQQPIEAAAMADACSRAATVTGEGGWVRALAQAVAWFDGDNDAGASMSDPLTGGGYDGLHQSGPNLNQGAESTLALVFARQHARRLAVAPA